MRRLRLRTVKKLGTICTAEPEVDLFLVHCLVVGVGRHKVAVVTLAPLGIVHGPQVTLQLCSRLKGSTARVTIGSAQLATLASNMFPAQGRILEYFATMWTRPLVDGLGADAVNAHMLARIAGQVEDALAQSAGETTRAQLLHAVKRLFPFSCLLVLL